MSITVAIDPGVKLMAMAEFLRDELQAVHVFRGDSLEETTRSLAQFRDARELRLVIEKPVIYDPRKWKGDPNDLIREALAAGAAAACFPNGSLSYIRPADWKGQRKKPIDNRYTLALLNSDERELLDGVNLLRSLMHNVLDAVGIGLWAVGRRKR